MERAWQRIGHQENTAAPTYYLRSTGMGGAVVAELNQSGQRLYSYVYAGKQILAKYENNVVEWQRYENGYGHLNDYRFRFSIMRVEDAEALRESTRQSRWTKDSAETLTFLLVVRKTA